VIKIGVIGNFIKTSKILFKIYSLRGYNIKIINCINNNNNITCDVLILNIETKNAELINILKLNMLIINKSISIRNFGKTPLTLSKNGILLINADNKNDLIILDYNNPYIITYGFNNKSTITLSSLSIDMYKNLQVCIQRSIVTISGKIIYEQEFNININDNDVAIILLYITIALINDFNIEQIKSNII